MNPPRGGAPAVLGVGIDAVEIERFRRLLERRGGFAQRCFTEAERDALGARRDPVPGLAARFAAKAAAMKALGVGLGAIGLREVEVVRSSSGRPELRAHGRAAALASSLGIRRFDVSLTHTATLASAVVVAS